MKLSNHDEEEEADEEDESEEDRISDVPSSAISCRDVMAGRVLAPQKVAVGSGTQTQTASAQTTTATKAASAGKPPKKPEGDGGDGGGGSASGPGSSKDKAKAKSKNKSTGDDRKQKPAGNGDQDPDDEGDDDLSDLEIVRRYRQSGTVGLRPGRLRKKELDKIDIHDLPKTAAHYQTWFFGVANAVSAAAIDPDSALDWVSEVDKPTATFEALLDRGEEASLDQKLLNALTKAAGTKHEILMTDVHKASRKVKNAGDGQIRGRQALWIIKRFYAVDVNDKVIYELHNLIDHHFTGDNDLERWKIHWDHLGEFQETPLTSKQKERIFYGHLKGSKILAKIHQRV